LSGVVCKPYKYRQHGTILQENLKHNEPEDEQFTEYKKTYELFRREIQQL
jgi:hypothetical protein